MAGPPEHLAGAMAWVVRKITELERRQSGRRRRGIIESVDAAAGKFRVRFADGFLSPPVPAQAVAAGALQIQAEPTVGQSVIVESQSGDMTDGFIAFSAFTNTTARPHGQAGELAIAVGAASIIATGTEIRLDVGGSQVLIDGSKVVLNAGGSEVRIDAAGVAITGAGLTHNGKNVGDNHRHSGVATGGSNTGTPV